jgi:hypothetical protein
LVDKALTDDISGCRIRSAAVERIGECIESRLECLVHRAGTATGKPDDIRGVETESLNVVVAVSPKHLGVDLLEMNGVAGHPVNLVLQLQLLE